MISLDCETTGVDLHHGAMPFLVTICHEDGTQRFWEWDVDPLTRKVKVSGKDAMRIAATVEEADLLILQNPKFDATALKVAGIVEGWPWEKTRCTLMAGHLLGSNLRHDLTSMCRQYLFDERGDPLDIGPFEERLKAAVVEARKIAKRTYPEWRIARKGLPEMPSAKGGSKRGERGVESESPWKFDCWLLRAMCKELQIEADHPWQTMLADYANMDSAGTMLLWKAQEQLIKERGLWNVYLHKIKVLAPAMDMEHHGVTGSWKRLKETWSEYREEAEAAGKVCVNIAAGMDFNLQLPRGASPNNSLREFCFNKLELTPRFRKKAKSDLPSLDKAAIDWYVQTLPQGSKALTFVKSLRAKRKRDTALAYMDGYERFALPFGIAPSKAQMIVLRPGDGRPVNAGNGELVDDGNWFVLHPNLNPTGTDTLRWSSSNPNEQNISKQDGFNLRRIFGPAPGREWWSLDGKNLELRIPAYEAGEEDVIWVFDHPNDPPYFGSYHLLVFDLLWPDLFKEHGVKCKESPFDSTNYQWCKNGNFLIIYGGQRELADATYHRDGAFDLIAHRFPKIAALNGHWIDHAERTGQVETMPDRDVDPDHGHPLLVSRGMWGAVEPTKPFNYHISGTAMQWTNKAMIRTHAQLREWDQKEGFRGRLALQVHDELVPDFPAPRLGPGTPQQLKDEPWRLHLPRVKRLQRLMEQGGDDIGVPTPVSIEYHVDNWAEGVTI